MSEELFETYDESGRPAGLVPRSRVHREGCWHRAVNIFLFRSDGRLVLQCRHRSKDVWPGAWDLSVAEHLKPGESYREAALRGLREELGVAGAVLEALGDVETSRLDDPATGVRDYELQQAFRAVFDGPLSPDPEEVLETVELGMAELAERIKRRPASFTPWFRDTLDRLELLEG